MSAGEDTMTQPDQDSFESLLDSTCSRLWERKLRYSLKRIGELTEILDKADRELEELLLCGRAPKSGDFLSSPPVKVPSVETARAGNKVP
jgi:hypothetical protein